MGVASCPAVTPPSISLLLEMDRRYREIAHAPRRFLPRAETCLPVLYHELGGWSLTAFYSGTPLAHKLGHARDWVVIHYRRGRREDRATVFTESHGPLRGRRIVRGREPECAAHYAELAAPAPQELRS